jgi:hypothetical protein
MASKTLEERQGALPYAQLNFSLSQSLSLLSAKLSSTFFASLGLLSVVGFHAGATFCLIRYGVITTLEPSKKAQHTH